MKPSKDKYDKVASSFWTNVTYLMKKKGMTWATLAGEIGTEKSILTTRKSLNTNVSLGSARDIAEALGVSVDRLIYGYLGGELDESISS